MKTGKDVLVSNNVDIRYTNLVEFGNHVAVDSYFCCSTQLITGDYVHIGPLVSIIGGKESQCKLGHFSGIAAGCRIICASDSYSGEGLINPLVPEEYRDEVIGGLVKIEDFVTLGTNAIVMPGVTLSVGTVVAAGGVVTQDTRPWTLYAGNPARPLKDRPSEKMLQYAKDMGYDDMPRI